MSPPTGSRPTFWSSRIVSAYIIKQINNFNLNSWLLDHMKLLNLLTTPKQINSRRQVIYQNIFTNKTIIFLSLQIFCKK